MHAFVLAGGFATRLWPLTEKRAKPLLPLAGKPMLTHLVENIPSTIPVTVSTNAVFAEDFELWKKHEHYSHVQILIEDAGHEGEKLGALGAVAQWIRQEQINDDVLLLAGDNYIGFSIEACIKAFTGLPLIAAYDVQDLEEATKFGTVVTSGTHVTAFEEKPQRPKSTLVSTGCTIIPQVHLPILTAYAKDHPDNIGGIFEHLLTEHIDVHCKAFTQPWFDVGSFEAYLQATQALVGNQALRAEDIEEYDNTFTGSVVLGKGSRVHHCVLNNVVLFEGCTLTDCVLTDCILDNHCTLNGIDLTGKMLREGTKLVH